MSNETKQNDKPRDHEKHQRLMESHRRIKAEKREDHNHENRTRNFPPNSLK
jgi:hypothetical protein